MTLEASNVVHASRHYERAGLRPQAFRTSLTAAREASRISARHEAFELYQRAIANMPADLPIEEQADLFARPTARPRTPSSRTRRASTAAKRARELYLEAGRPHRGRRHARPHGRRARRATAHPRSAVHEMHRQVLAEIDALPPSQERRSGPSPLPQHDRRTTTCSLRATTPRAPISRPRASSRERVGDRETLLENDLTRARIDIVDGRYETGVRDGHAGGAGSARRRLRIRRRHRLPEPRDHGRPDHGPSERAELAIGEGLQYADAIEQSHCRQMIATTTAILDWAAGNWEAADERARQELVDRGCVRGHDRLARRGGPRRPWPGPARRGPPVAGGIARDRPADRRGAVHPDPALGTRRGGSRRGPPGARRRALRGGLVDRGGDVRVGVVDPVRRHRARGRSWPRAGPEDAERWLDPGPRRISPAGSRSRAPR